MLVKKTWNRNCKFLNGFGYRKTYSYTGWFLLGIIPIYIERKTLRDI